MKKEIIIIGAVAIALIVASTLALTNMFTVGRITGKPYSIDNVYEEIWNMVDSEKNGGETVLTTAIKGSHVDYDLLAFQHVYIPVNDKYHVSLSFEGRELCIFLFENNDIIYEHDNDACYVYNCQTNTLYGNKEESLLFDNFTSLYYSWVGNDSKFSPENQGDYTYVFDEYPLTHE